MLPIWHLLYLSPRRGQVFLQRVFQLSTLEKGGRFFIHAMYVSVILGAEVSTVGVLLEFGMVY